MYQSVKYYQENYQRISQHSLESRNLWDDHISYTRNIIISVIAGLPDIDFVSARLIKNQEDIGNFISSYFSIGQVNTLVDLLKQHINIAVNVINGVEGAEESWRMNGKDITKIMSHMNSNFWSVGVTDPLWTQHLDMTIAQINHRKNNMWEEDIKAYDDNHICMNKFADLFASGIVHQNLEKFSSYVVGV